MTLDIVAHPATAGIKNNITVIKTLGNQEPFDREKLLSAVKKATGYAEGRVRIAEDICEFVMKKLSAPTVATGYINALVEGYLLAKYEKTKNSEYKIILDKYIQNKRRKQDELMQKVSHMKDVILGAGSIKDLRKFSFNQTQIAAARYLLRDIETGEVIETIPEWFHRVASHVVIGSIMYDDEIYSKESLKGKKYDVNCPEAKNLGGYQINIIIEKHKELLNHMKFGLKKTIKIIDTKLIDKYNYLYKQYYDFMYEGIFEPNTPTLLNMGTPSGAGSACFTLAVMDDMRSIMNTGTDAAFIFKTGGGLGTNISYIRPKGSPVGHKFNAATGGIALVLEHINFITDIIKAGGCFIGSTLVATEFGPIPIRDIKPNTSVYSFDKTKGFVLRKTKTGSWLTKRGAEVWKLITDKGLEIFATPNHKIMTRPDKKYIELRNLIIGTPIMALSRYIKDNEWVINSGLGNDTRYPEHVWMAKELGIEGENIHHIDNNHLNNISSNLQGLSISEHHKIHDNDYIQKGIHPFQRLTKEQRQKSIEGYKKWRSELSGAELQNFLDKTTWQLKESNDKRLKDGTHNFLTNCPSKDPKTKIIMQKSRIANSIWKIMSKGLNPTRENWETLCSDLYNTQRFTINKINEIFGSFEEALVYTNQRNHRVVSVGFSHYEDVYDIEVEDTHNFVVCDQDRKGIVVSNSRRGANMGIMEYWHPQILEFIDYKLTPGKLENFNISVMFDDNFWQCYNNDKDFDLVFNNKKYDRIDPHDLIRKIADNAWKSAEPGVLFADNANKKNPLRDLWGDIKVTNPCVSSRTRLHTNKGMKTVEELYRNNTEIEVAVDTVVHRSFKRYSKANETQMMQMKASKVFKTADDADLLKIETEDGYELECTPYHPMVLADGSMKDASDLKDGDELLLQSSKGLFGVEGNSDIGALLGFAQNHMQLIAPEDKFIDDIFQKYTMLNKFDNIYHRLNSQYISNMYGEPMPLNAALDFCKFKVNVVPDVVWNGKEQCVKSYLKLLFSTSAVCVVERELIRYYNNNRRFLQDLQILLINFGIKSTIRGDDPYYITVSGKSFKPFMYKVGLTTSFKIRNIDVPKNSTGEVKYFTKVINVTKLPGKHMVYDAEEYETHKLIFNGIITGNCVISDTLLATSNGMERVGDLYKSGKQLIIPTDNRTENYDPNNMGITPRTAVPIFKTSDSEDVWEVETEQGYSVTATNYHKFYIKEEKNRYKKYIVLKELKDLKIGDKLLIQSDEGYFGKQGSRELGAVIGWYQADGYDTKAMDWRKENEKKKIILDFYHEKKELTNKFLEYVNLILPKTKSNIQDVSIMNIDGRNQQTIQSTRLGDLFISNNIIKYLVPDVIWQGTKECVVAYLQSLFSADGTINISNSTCSIRLSSINREFLKQVQMILGNLGIQCAITKRRDECERSLPDGKGGVKSYRCQSYYEIIISGNNIVVFSKQVGFMLKYKQDKLEGFINSRTKPILSKSPYTSKIKSIEYRGKQAVYDTTEHKTHTILINNVVSSQCSEQYMYHGESCTLGSINLSKFTDDIGSGFDWTGYEQAINISTQFLNDVLEVNQYPTEDIKKNSNITKRIGLGIMGLADLLFRMRIPYNSEEGYNMMTALGGKLYSYSVFKSISLAEQRGACDAYNMLLESGKKPIDSIKRIYPEIDDEITKIGFKYEVDRLEKYGVRNMWTTTIAPTGTISMIADCSNGLEPIYALVYKKTVQTGDHYYLNKEFEKALVAEGLYSDEIIKKVEQNYGSVQGLDEIPKWMQDVFVTAMDLHWTDHVVAQAIWQQWIDNSISKTCNMPYNVTPEDIEYAYVLAHELGLKGLSVYRDGSRHLQVLHTDTSVKTKEGEIGAKSSKEITLIKKQLAPSAATIDYIMKNVKNKDILNKFMKYIDNDKQQQVYIQANEKCEKCNEGVYVDQGGCRSCNICGYSISCSVG